jgi:hypothetical protein
VEDRRKNKTGFNEKHISLFSQVNLFVMYFKKRIPLIRRRQKGQVPLGFVSFRGRNFILGYSKTTLSFKGGR